MSEFICSDCDCLCVLDVEDDNPELPEFCPYLGEPVIWERLGGEIGTC